MHRPSQPADRRALLESACRELVVAALYLFGSRADAGLYALDGASISRGGSDLDVGVLFQKGDDEPRRLARQVALEDVFAVAIAARLPPRRSYDVRGFGRRTPGSPSHKARWTKRLRARRVS